MSSEEEEIETTRSSCRFIRIIAGKSLENPTIVDEKVEWLSRLQVYRASSTLDKLSIEPDFISARCVGMDAASALAVEALDPQPGMGILDLCCAPGMKLAAIAELMRKEGQLVGVDVSEMRLNTTAAVLRKYKVAEEADDDDGKIRDNNWDLSLWQCDGREFHPTLKKGTLTWSSSMNRIFTGGKTLPVARKRAGKGLRKLLHAQANKEAQEKTMCPEFDRVLIDAECTTDGRTHPSSREEVSYKRKKWTGETGEASPEEEADTEKLQFELLSNGFGLLKPGGFLVYSTCSLREGQNEGVLANFMKHEPRAKLVPPLAQYPQVPAFVQSSRILGNLGWRLNPAVSGTSGMFIARLMKV